MAVPQNPIILEIINRWMRDDPAGLENDDPAFLAELKAEGRRFARAHGLGRVPDDD